MAESQLSDYVLTHESDSIADQIRNMILRVDLLPGAQLKEQVLAEQFGVSRTPVRQALIHLIGEGLVVQLPRLGFFVRKLRLEECMELLELRRTLEALAASLAAKHITPSQAAELEELAAAVDVYKGKQFTAEICEVELRFHRRVIELAGNSELSRVLGQLQVVYLTLAPDRVYPQILEGERETDRFSHVDAARAIAGGDRQKAHDVMWAQFEPTMTELHGNNN